MSAGNFKEMRQMAGLCNICDELGAFNWKKLTELIEALRNEISGVPPTVDTEESDIAAEDENDDDLTSEITNHVAITDLTEEDEFKLLKPLPVDSPVLMIEVGVNSPDFNNFLRRSINLKGHLLSDFTTELQTHSSCPFHCMELLLNAKVSCKNHCDICMSALKDLHCLMIFYQQ